MSAYNTDIFVVEAELAKIKELLAQMFNASSPKEFLESQQELKKYVK